MKPKIKRLKDVTHLVQSLDMLLKHIAVPKIQLQRVSKNEMQVFDEDRFAWVVKQSVMCLVRLEISGV